MASSRRHPLCPKPSCTWLKPIMDRLPFSGQGAARRRQSKGFHPKTKAEAVSLLKDSVQFVKDAIGSMDDATLAEPIKFLARIPTVWALLWLLADTPMSTSVN